MPEQYQFAPKVSKTLALKKLKPAFYAADRFMRAYDEKYHESYPAKEYAGDKSGIFPEEQGDGFTAIWAFRSLDAAKTAQTLFKDFFGVEALILPPEWKAYPRAGHDDEDLHYFSVSPEKLLKAAHSIQTYEALKAAMPALNSRLKEAHSDISFEASLPHYGKMFAYKKLDSEDPMPLIEQVEKATGMTPVFHRDKGMEKGVATDLRMITIDAEKVIAAAPRQNRKAPASLLSFASRQTGTGSNEL